MFIIGLFCIYFSKCRKLILLVLLFF